MARSPSLFTHLLTPTTTRLLMSKSMCGCGCSIISSLMKRLGRTACCSDLLSCSHTSEQLQRLASGCPPQPQAKVTAHHRPLTRQTDQTDQTALMLRRKTYQARQCVAESITCVKSIVLVYLPGLSRTIFQV